MNAIASIPPKPRVNYQLTKTINNQFESAGMAVMSFNFEPDFGDPESSACRALMRSLGLKLARPRQMPKYLEACASVISNLKYAVDNSRNNPCVVLVKISSNAQSLPPRYKSHTYGQKVLVKVIEAMERKGYLVLHKGFKGKGHPTGLASSIEPTKRFKRWLKYYHGRLTLEAQHKDQEVLILKDTTSANNKTLLDYEDTKHTHELRANIEKINKVNARYEWSFVPPEQLKSDYPEDELYQVLSPAMLRYKRVFSGDFESGGRFYCRLQALNNRRDPQQGLIPSRPHIRINGWPTEEIDYKSQHLCHHRSNNDPLAPT